MFFFFTKLYLFLIYYTRCRHNLNKTKAVTMQPVTFRFFALLHCCLLFNLPRNSSAQPEDKSNEKREKQKQREYIERIKEPKERTRSRERKELKKIQT